jgi:hypothetical protein
LLHHQLHHRRQVAQHHSPGYPVSSCDRRRPACRLPPREGRQAHHGGPSFTRRKSACRTASDELTDEESEDEDFDEDDEESEELDEDEELDDEESDEEEIIEEDSMSMAM